MQASSAGSNFWFLGLQWCNERRVPGAPLHGPGVTRVGDLKGVLCINCLSVFSFQSCNEMMSGNLHNPLRSQIMLSCCRVNMLVRRLEPHT